MPKPVYLMTVQVYNSLTDKIIAKYKELDSGEFGSPGTLAFDAETCSCERTLPETEPATSKGIIQSSSTETLFGSKFSVGRQFVRMWRMQALL